jgi:hypothetical protein
LTHIYDKRVKLWKETPVDDDAQHLGGNWFAPRVSKQERSSCGEKFPVRCHCGGIDFFIAPPNTDTFQEIEVSLISHDKSKWHGSYAASVALADHRQLILALIGPIWLILLQDY